MSEPAITLPCFIADAFTTFPLLASYEVPWSMVTHAAVLVRAALRTLGSEYTARHDPTAKEYCGAPDAG